MSAADVETGREIGDEAGRAATGQTVDGAFQAGVRRKPPVAHDAAWRPAGAGP